MWYVAILPVQADDQMLTGSTSTQEQNEAYRRMEHGATSGLREIRVRLALSRDRGYG